MNYKKIVLSVMLLSHVLYALGNQISSEGAPNRFCGPTFNGSENLESIGDVLCELANKIDSLQCCDNQPSCEATVITQAGILTESGIYCLGNDVEGTIFIIGSSITLNLNGHVVLSGSDGIAIAATASDVRIKNGMVRGSGADRGIFVNGAADVRIEDVTCENWNTGIYCLSASRVTLDRVTCDNNQCVGLLCETTLEAIARNCIFSRNTTGAKSTAFGAAEFVSCSALSNSTGFFSELGAVVLRDCTSLGSDIGYFNENTAQVDYFNCFAGSNTTGFELNGGRVNATNCVSQGNFVGFFSNQSFGEIIFRECVASSNQEYGFLEQGSTDDIPHMYLNCVACNNGTNYSSNIIDNNNAPVTTAAAARGFENIDCSLEVSGTSCEAKKISGPQTLTESGIYCLTNDVVGIIVITGSSITLDLNGYTVLAGSDGIEIAATASDVRIKNGMVRGSGADRGIFVNGAADVRIEDVTCENWNTGIYCLNASRITLDRVTCDNNQCVGLLCETTLEAIARSCIFSRNTTGAKSTAFGAAEFVSCSALSNSTGFFSELGAVVFRDCTSLGSDIGYFNENTADVDYFNCFAGDNATGFELNGGRVNATNCVSQANTVGFFSNQSFGEIIFRECVASSNQEYGFLEQGSTDNIPHMYLNCVACNNGTNYSSNIIDNNNAPVTTPTAARGFENIDCSLPQPATCAAKRVSEAQTLTEPGIYCLTNNVAGTIVITGSSITLDLNGYAVLAGSDGIEIAATASDVRIKNGMVRGSGADRGIFVNGAADVRIEDVTCENWNTGIYCLNASRITLDRVTCDNNQCVGLLCETTLEAIARNCIFSRNTTGAKSMASSAAEFVSCSALSNSTGFFSELGTVVFRDCTSLGSDIGYFNENNAEVDYFNCFADDNATGFELNGGRVNATNCVSQGNTVGFFSNQSFGEIIFRECVASSNQDYGFLEQGSTDNIPHMYLNCVACNNGTNYSSNIIDNNNAPVTTPTAARGFENIDCNLPEPATCAAKKVSEAQTLTEPGIYCLTNDIFGTITIEGEGITLDLNGYTVRGGLGNAIVVTNSDEIRIKNGRAEGNYSDLGAGLFITDSFNVRIEDITVEGWAYGIEVHNGGEVSLDRIFANYNNELGALIDSVANSVIRDSIFDFNLTVGLYITGGSQAEVVRCSGRGDFFTPSTDQITSDVSCFGVDSSQVIFRDCSASGHAIGFNIECAESNVDMYNCVAESNFEGFWLNGNRIYATNCVANNNDLIGFFMPVLCEGSVTLRDCFATGNSSFGFFDATVPTDTSVNMYLSCVACNNGTNYSPNIIASNNAPVNSAATARGFDNVDCSAGV